MSYDSGREAQVASTDIQHTEVCLRTNCRLSITNNLDKATPEVGEKRFSMLCTACHFYENSVCIKHIWRCVCRGGGTGGSILGAFGNIWRHFMLSQGGVLLAQSGKKPRTLLNIPQEQNSPTIVLWPQCQG